MRGESKILVSFRASDNLIHSGLGSAAGKPELEQVARAESGGVADSPAVRAYGKCIASRQDGVWIKLNETVGK
mgnify:CR=1 FL=1